jgi:hypothetical protein
MTRMMARSLSERRDGNAGAGDGLFIRKGLRI